MLVLVIVVAAGLVRALYLSYKLTRYLARSALEQCNCRLRTRVRMAHRGCALGNHSRRRRYRRCQGEGTAAVSATGGELPFKRRCSALRSRMLIVSDVVLQEERALQAAAATQTLSP
jgi:hypothetical protein